MSPEASKLPTSAVVPMMGVPGEVQNLVTRNVLAGKPDTATVQWRPYRVQLMLGRPGYPIDPAYTHGFIESRVGNSHLRVVKPLAERKPDDPDKMIWQSVYVDKSGKRIDVQFLGEFNAQGYLGKFSATVEANDANEAAWTAHASLAPLLSSLSASADVPLFIESIDAVEEATGNGLTRWVNPFPEQAFNFGSLPLFSEDYCHYASFTAKRWKPTRRSIASCVFSRS